MDKTIKRIIEIDRETILLKNKTQEVLEEKKTKFHNKIKVLDLQYGKEGQEIGEESYKAIISEARSLIDEQERHTDKVLNNLENIYNNKKQSLIAELWQDIFMKE